MKKKLVMLIGFLPNPRIYKRLALERELFDVHLICWDRGSEMQAPPKAEGFRVHCLRIPACSDPLRRLLPYGKFSVKAKKLIKAIGPDIIHVQGLDMLRIAFAAKCPHVIYEVADLHRLLVDAPRNLPLALMQRLMKREEFRLCRSIDLLIVTSAGYVKQYFHAVVPMEKILVFPNMPDLTAFQSYRRKKDGEFTVGFIGDIRYPEQMRNLLDAARACDMRVMFAGFEQGGHTIEELCRSYSKGEWLGRFDFLTQAAELYGKCDVIYSVYNGDMVNVRVAIPNKLYEAVYCGLPIIVAKNTYLSEIVEDWGVGVAVDHRGPEELIDALKKLREDRGYYASLVRGCDAHRNEIDLHRYNEKLKQILLKL